MKQYHIDPIGIIHSPYKEKFAIPRQPNLVCAATGELHLSPPYSDPNSVKGLEQFSHLWLLFLFHHIDNEKWAPTVRPPRLGGNKKLGVFATRSPFRPNHIGLSAVELHDITTVNGQVILKLGSVDLVDQTPIIDIKPYIPYSDSYPQAQAGYAQNAPIPFLDVQFSQLAQQKLLNQTTLQALIIQVIQQDPRPAYKQKNTQAQQFGVKLMQFNIHFQVENNIATILDIEE